MTPKHVNACVILMVKHMTGKSFNTLYIYLITCLTFLGAINLASAEPANRSYCRFGTLAADSCGCNCSAPFTSSGTDCACDSSLCATDYSLGYPLPEDNCNCYCHPYYVTNGATMCSYYGATFDSVKCGCKCPTGKKFDQTVWRCACITTIDCASQGKIFDNNTCSCICDPNLRNTCVNSGGTFNSGTCTCGGCVAPKVLQGSSCECPAHDLPSPFQTYDNQNCRFGCKSGYGKHRGGDACFENMCGNPQCDPIAWYENLGKCECRP
jgi:hypothetical protein